VIVGDSPPTIRQSSEEWRRVHAYRHAGERVDPYFATTAVPARGAVATRLKAWEISAVSFLDRLNFGAALGRKVLVSFVKGAAGMLARRHPHEEEQFTFVVEGELEIDAGEGWVVDEPRGLVEVQEMARTLEHHPEV
jgi:hypothetical protein